LIKDLALKGITVNISIQPSHIKSQKGGKGTIQNTRKNIFLDGLRRHKLEIEEAREELEKFYDQEFKRKFQIFPPFVDNSKQGGDSGKN
jgi:hypothetical protein